MWINKEKTIFLLRDMPFRNAIVGDQLSYKGEVFNIVESSFSHLDVFDKYAEGLSTILVGVFASNTSFMIDGESFDVSFGDCIITTTPQAILHIEQEFILTEFEIYFTDQKARIGDGVKEYEVISIVRDEYRIKVFANSEEEALALANKTPPSKWEHLEIDTHIEQRNLIRMARWGNFTAKELS